MRDVFKAGGVVALSAGVFAVLYPLAGGSLAAPAGSKNVGSCSTVGGQSTVGSQSVVCGTPPTTPFVANIPSNATRHGSFVAVVVTNGDGRRSVTSETPKICKVDGDKLRVRFSGIGTCTLTAHVSAGIVYASADGAPQSFAVG